MSPFPVSVGIVGLGRWAKVLTRAASKSGEIKIIAGYSRSQEKRAAFQRETGVPVVSDLRTMLSYPMMDGVILTERGEYVFMTRRFTVKRGSATFINSTELNPTLQGTAQYKVNQPNREAINIQIVVGGTLHSPNISLTSDAQPPIPQSDLLSYLAFGQSSSSLVQLEGSGLTNGSGGSNLVGAGAALASRQLAGVAIGVVTLVLRLAYGATGPTNNDGAQLVIGSSRLPSAMRGLPEMPSMRGIDGP